MSGPLRICMMTTFYPPYSFGGDAIFVQRLSNQLAQRGHTVDVIHCVDSYNVLARHKPKESAIEHSNPTVHALHSPVGFVSPLLTQQTGLPLFKSRRIREILKKGFDVIHYHNISLLGPNVLQYGDAVKLYTMHEYWLLCPTHVLFKFKREACIEQSCLACTLSYGRLPQWWRYTGQLDRAMRHIDAFISPSQFGKKIHQRINLDSRIVHLPNFVPPVTSMSEQIERVTNPYFLFVGRLEKLKGLQTLLPVFRRPGKADLLIAGTGSYEVQLRQLASGYERIKFLGQQTESELQALYRHAVAVIVPSICFEMFPLVILEAFREQTPVIARNIGGITEVIEESGGGLLYNSDADLTGSLERVLADPAYRDVLGTRGHAAYLRTWTVDTHLDRYLALIDEITKKKRSIVEHDGL